MKQLMLLLEESQASKEAKAKGLEYLSFGRYGKSGKQTHAVENGRLVPITSGGKTASGKDTPAPTGTPKKFPGPSPEFTAAIKAGLRHIGHGLFADPNDKFGKVVYDSKDKTRPLPTLHISQKDFSSTTDTWFDDLSDAIGTVGGKPAETLRALAEKPPTANTLQQIKAVAPAFGTIGKKLGQHIDAVLSGKSFGKEFKKQYGPHSQASELVSMIRQAVNYGN